jgi:hypothetical protein
VVTRKWAKLCDRCRAVGREQARLNRAATHAWKMENDPAYRARREITLAKSRAKSRRKDRVEPAPKTGTLPALPVAVAIYRIAAQEERLARWGMPSPTLGSDGKLAEVCERIGVNERTVYAWRHGERRRLRFYNALEVVDRLGLLWGDVWNDETVRRPALLAMVYVRSRRLRSGLHLRRLRTVPYGDLGPDHRELAYIDTLFEVPTRRAA